MQVILRRDVENLGKSGDVLTVKDGYACNFLIPKGLAFKANPGNLKVAEEEKKAQSRRAEKEKTAAERLAERIASISCTIPVQVGADDKMFGSVTNADIAQALETEGIKLDKKMIELPSPLKDIGVFQVPVKLHPEVSAEIKVWVVKD